MEEWKVIDECPKYLINRLGQVKSIEGKYKDKIKTPTLCKRGYYIYTFTTENGRIARYLHRLLAIAFIPNPENKPEIDHIDRNRTNNSLDNLRWVSKQENNNNRGPKAGCDLYIANYIRVSVPNHKVKYFKTREEAIAYRDAILNQDGRVV